MAFQVGMGISFLVLLFFGGFSFSILELFLSVAFVELVDLFIMLMILVSSSGHDLRSVCSFISRKVVNKYRHIIYG